MTSINLKIRDFNDDPYTIYHFPSNLVCVCLHDVLWFYVLSDCDDKCSKTVFIPLHTAVNNVMSEFFQYVDN